MTRIRGCCTRLRRKRDEIPKVTLKVTNILLFGGQILLFVIRERELVHEIRRKRYEIPQSHSQSRGWLIFYSCGQDFYFHGKHATIWARCAATLFYLPFLDNVIWLLTLITWLDAAKKLLGGPMLWPALLWPAIQWSINFTALQWWRWPKTKTV